MIIMQQNGSGIVELVIFLLFVIIALGAKLFEWIRNLQEREGSGDSGGGKSLQDLLKALRGEEEEDDEDEKPERPGYHEPASEVWTVDSRLSEESERASEVRPAIRTASFESFAEKVREKERLAREAMAAAQRARQEAEAIPILPAALPEPEVALPVEPSRVAFCADDLRGGIRWAVVLGSPRGLQPWGEDGGIRPLGL